MESKKITLNETELIGVITHYLTSIGENVDSNIVFSVADRWENNAGEISASVMVKTHPKVTSEMSHTGCSILPLSSSQGLRSGA
jgi:hypothetical protein